MKNKLMMLSMALVAIVNVTNANVWDIARIPHTWNYTNIPYTAGNGVTYYSRQHRDACLASHTTQFFNEQKAAQNLLSMAPKASALVVSNTSALVPTIAASSTFSRFARNPKVEALLTGSAVAVAGGFYAYSRIIKAQNQVQPTRMQRVQNALINAGSTVKANAVKAGSLVKSNVQAHPRIATGAGLVTLAGLSYAAYNKFGKAALNARLKKSNSKK